VIWLEGEFRGRDRAERSEGEAESRAAAVGFPGRPGRSFSGVGFHGFFFEAAWVWVRWASSSAVALEFTSKLGLLSARQFNG
jgi:hypothetical protein